MWGKTQHPADLQSIVGSAYPKEREKKDQRKKLKEAIFNFKQGLNVIERKSEQLRNAQGLERRLG